MSNSFATLSTQIPAFIKREPEFRFLAVSSEKLRNVFLQFLFTHQKKVKAMPFILE